jgi:hypothetical protein
VAPCLIRRDVALQLADLGEKLELLDLQLRDQLARIVLSAAQRWPLV